MDSPYESMPAEIMDSIMAEMSIPECNRAFGKASEDSTLGRCRNQRTSIEPYLVSLFGVCSELLYNMGQHGVYISGSRAADFFIRGSADEDSDCDFFISAQYGDAVAFMKYMESIGVRWSTPQLHVPNLVLAGTQTVTLNRTLVLQYLQTALSQKYDSVSGKSVTVKYYGSEHNVTEPPYLADFMSEWRPISSHACTLTVSGSEIYVDLRAEDDTGFAYEELSGICNVVKGQVQRGKNVMKVQLIQDRRKHFAAVSSVHKFHSTCVQAFIGATYAAHMYHTLAEHKECLFWKDNRVSTRDSEDYGRDLRDKYEQRGYKYIEYRGGNRIRLLNDKHVLTVEYPGLSELSQETVNRYQWAAKETVWYEYSDMNAEVKGPTISRDRNTGQQWYDEKTFHEKGSVEYCIKYGVIHGATEKAPSF